MVQTEASWLMIIWAAIFLAMETYMIYKIKTSNEENVEDLDFGTFVLINITITLLSLLGAVLIIGAYILAKNIGKEQIITVAKVIGTIASTIITITAIKYALWKFATKRGNKHEVKKNGEIHANKSTKLHEKRIQHTKRRKKVLPRSNIR